MASNLDDVRIVTFDKKVGRYSAGKHAMHVSVAEVAEKLAEKHKVGVKVDKVDEKKMIAEAKARIEKQKSGKK